MLVETKARVGVFAIALGAYLPQFPGLVPEFEGQYAAFKKTLPDYANTDTPTWLGELYACGAVGEMVADLERAGKRHAVITGVVEGGDPAVQAEINDWCKAAQVRRRFRDTNLAQIGRPYPGMMDLYIDETNLYNRMWLYTKQFDWEKMWAIADNVTDEAAIRAKAEDILNTFDIEGGATVETVWDMGQAGFHADPRLLDADQAGHGLRRRGRHQGRHGDEHPQDHCGHRPAQRDVLHRL